MEIKTISFDKQDDIMAAIRNHETFDVGGCGGRMSEAVKWVKRAIEGEGLRSRTYTSKRSAVAAVAGIGGVAGWASMTIIPVLGVSLAPVVGLAGIGAAAGIAAHRLATFNPDYEIMKRLIEHALRVTYKKKNSGETQAEKA